MICSHKLNHFTFANTRFTAPLTRRGKTKFANVKFVLLPCCYFKEHSDSNSKCIEEDIIKMLDFLVDNIFVVFVVFQQIFGIPIVPLS